jgi:PKD repeat protein
MRLLLFLFLIPTLIYSQFIEVNYRLRLTNSFGISSETIIAFDSTTSDGVDNCCDALYLPSGSGVGIYTKIDNSNYAINAYSKLTTDRSISLYTLANPDTGTFTLNVVDTTGYETTILSLSDSNFPEQLFNFPYTTEGPITGQRFTLHTSAPVKISVVNGCDSDSGGTVYINNPNYRWGFELFYNGELIEYGDIGDSVFTNLQSGSYQYKWYNQIGNQTLNFEISNNTFDYELILPYNYLWIQDPGVVPELLITGNYDQIIWDFGDGRVIYDDINPVHYYSEVGQYILSVTVTSGNCSKTIQEIITVDNVFGFPNINVKNKTYLYYYGIDGRLFKR